MGNELTERIAALLRAHPNQSAPQIAATLDDPAVDRTVVNRLLYTDRARFVVDSSGNPPRWSLRVRAKTTPRTQDRSAPPADPPQQLHGWQQRALAAWIGNGRNGIVEAVGGTGKSALGAHIVVEAIAAGTPAVVIVADDSARASWLDRLAELAPACRIAGLGGNPRPNAERTWQVAIVTPATAVRLRQIAPPAQCSNALLVVDDLDRHSAGVFAHALTDQFTSRLGLSRAVDRGDQTVRAQLAPYFGPYIAGCDYATARAEALLDPITLVQVGVELDAKERARLDQTHALVEREYDTLVGTYGAPESDTEFRAFVDALAAGRGSGAHHANRYLTAESDRATILAECRAKAEVLRALPAEVLADTQTVVFTDRPVAAGRVHQLLADRGISTATTSAALTPSQRSAIADRLADRSLKVLVEQRILEPALTVPDAGIALVLARSRDTTQLIHRLGRVLHPASPPRRRLVVVLFVTGSTEDPSRDGGAVAAIRPLAADSIRTDTAGLIALLEQWQGTAAPSAPANPPAPADLPEPGSAHTDIAPAPRPTGAEVEPGVYADFLDQLTNLGAVGTADEIGDVIGCCDPAELRELAETAARAGDLVFHEIGGHSEDLLLLATAPHTDRDRLRRHSESIATWAASSEDPIGGMYLLLAGLADLPVPPHRLIQIAAFLRGTTPRGLL